MAMTDFQAYSDFVVNSLKLMVWYVKHLVSREDHRISLSEALDMRVDILRHTALYDGRHPASVLDPPNADWEKLKSQLGERIFSNADPDELETECWELLEPLVAPILGTRYKRSRSYTDGPFQCWRYDFLPKHHFSPNLTDCVDIHFANACQPESPFARPYRERLLTSLREMLVEANNVHPTAKTAVCGSWLNRFPPFLELFPDVWAASFEAWEFSSGTAGHWGQYMDRRGGFHVENAAALRASGRHPYECGVCYCRIDDILDFLGEGQGIRAK